MLRTPSMSEVSTPSEEAAAQPKRWALILSFALSLALVGGVLLTVALSSNAYAAQYSLAAGGSWTGVSAWICTTAGAPGSAACGQYPGDPNAGGVGLGAPGDVATVSGGTVSLTSTIPNAVTLNMSAGNVTIGSAGQLDLINTSSVASSSSFLSVSSGGVLRNAGTINGSNLSFLSVNGGTLQNDSNIVLASGSTLTLGSGQISATGSGSITTQPSGASAAGVLNFSGAGPMTMSSQTVQNNGIINDTSSAAALTLNGTSIINTATGTFNLNSNAPIGGTASSISNAGAFNAGAIGANTVNVPFDNGSTGTVALTSSSGVSTLALNGGGTQAGTFSVSFPGDTFNFAGAHAINGPALNAPVNVTGGTFAVSANTNINGALTNAGAISFTGTGRTIGVTGPFTQNGSGSVSFRLDGTSPTLYDHITSTGAATLNGSMGATVGYSPANGDSLNVVTYSSETGTMTYAPATYPGGAFAAQYNPTALALIAVPTDADLGINITDAPDPVLAGGSVNYTAQVSNAGPAAANAPTVAFTLTGGTITGASGAGYTCSFSAGSATCTATGALAPGTSTITVIATAGTGASMSLTGSVSSTTNDPATGNNTSTQATTINPSADLQITKTGPATVNAGQNAVYSITVTNAGPSTATNVVVSDPTPIGTTFSGACSSNPCTIATMTSGQTVTFTATYAVPANASGTLTNTATVSTTSATDPSPSNNTATATSSITSSTDYAVVKNGPASASTGSTITYTVDVKNLGPSDGTGTITVSDPTPTGLTLLTVSGGGCTAYPCNVGPLAAGTFVTITSTYKVTATSGAVTNTATISLAATDPSTANNTSSVTTNISPNADLSITKTAPRTFSSTNSVTFAITVTNNGPGTASNVVVDDPTPAGLTFVSNSDACSTPFPCNLGSMAAGTSQTISARYVANAGTTSVTNSASVSSSTPDLNPNNNTASRSVASACPSAPQIVSPTAGTLTSPVTFTWTASAGADSYTLFVGANGASPSQVGQPTTATTLSTDVPNGAITWYVLATSAQCPAGTPSNTGSFNACSAPAAPEAGVVGAPTSGQPYAVLWDPVLNASSYEIQEATNASFTDAVTQNTSAQSVTFTHNTTAGALVFFYRVRALGTCNGTAGAYSRIVRVVVLPPPANQKYPNFDIPAGTQNRVQLEVFIEGEPSGPQNFTITLDKPWMVSVDPSSGVLPTAGRKVTLTVDPAQLPNGTFTGTLLVDLTPVSSNSRIESNANKPKATPVTVNLVTPIIPTTPTGPTPDTIIIPAVGRLTGINSQWRSDVRVFNGSSQALKYQLDFLPSQASESKKTTISTAPGDTTALDDVIHNWYGFGEVGDNASGVLQIRALTSNGSAPPSSTSLATVVSSRTYNNTPEQGTLGQFIPGILFRNFVGRQTDAAKAVAVLSLQQLAQTNSYRTNVGIVEGAGAPATVLLSIFNAAGQKLTQDFSLSLKAGEQVALNQLLAQKGITANDARLEVRVTGGDGKVTAYASVVDNNSLDPLLVSPVVLGQTSARTYVLPGVADLNTGSASWRSDLRILNGGSVPQAVDVLFYPQGNAANPAVASLTVNPGEVKVLDNVLASLFATTNAGGAVHVNTVNDSQLVVTGRTFNQTGNGTLGQFIPAATLQDSIDRTTRGLNILQVEDSVRYRTNVGLAEMSGQPATVQVSVNLPDSKVTPTIQIPLAANEFRQFALRDLGLANIYNARVSINVISGNGKVTAYGSVIDMTTSDPTYVPAQ